VENDGELTAELNGTPFSKEISSRDTVRRGVQIFPLCQRRNQWRGSDPLLRRRLGGYFLEIRRNKTEKGYSYDGGKLKITIKNRYKVFLNEAQKEIDPLDENQMTDIAEKASKKL
jgi:hypothetical protein